MAYVGPEGPLSATIAIVGEKPGKTELQLSRPFVGASGRELNELLSKIGLSRSAVYITNAVKQVENLNNPTAAEIRAEIPTLWRELSRLPNLRVIVAMGVAALQSLTAFQLDKIGSYRGSILPSFLPNVKIIPTYHPAFYMRGEWRFKPIVRFDLSRALEESYANSAALPLRRYFIAQTRTDLDSIKQSFLGAKYISFDIELLRGRYIECIAFSRSPDEAYCIPITNGNRNPCWNSKDECLAWRVIQAILAQKETTYVSQNGLFDCWHLWRHGISSPYMSNGYDTMLMHRLRAPDLPHDLGFLVSIYTREPYYKDESGDWKLQQRAISDTQFRIYNCKDAACTLEVCLELIKDLTKTGQLENYQQEVQPQWPCVTSMRQKGMRIDVSALATTRSELSTQISKLETTISGLVGFSPNTQSSIDMERLYRQLGITSYSKTPTGKPKRDIEQLYTLAAAYPKHRALLYAIAHLNELRTLRAGFLSLALDQHGFYHPALSISKTVTGRMASTGADEGGPQIQNIPKSLRNLFVPDGEGDEFTQADLAGAESVLLAYYSEDPLLMEAFEKGKNVHRVRGAVIYHGWNNTTLPQDDILKSIKKVCSKCAPTAAECNHSEYYMSKKNGHAFAYMQGVLRAAKELRKVGVFTETKELERIKNLVVTPWIRDNFQKKTELDLRRSAWLVTPLNRKREFYGILDSEMLRAALSWKCQAVVGQITNRAMIKLHEVFAMQPECGARIVTQTHDSLLISHHPDSRVDIKGLLAGVFHQPVTINARTFVIPIEITHGPNWRDMK